jgi:hypothetical protein
MGEYLIVICRVICDCFFNFQHQVLLFAAFREKRIIGKLVHLAMFDMNRSGNPSAAPATVIGENYSATAIMFVGRE